MAIGMKLTSVLLFGAAISTATVSCVADTAEPGDSRESAVLHGDTEIEAAEQQLGVSLVKETKTIRDDRDNSVTLLVASKRREIVDDFLNNIDISIEVLPSSTLSDSMPDTPVFTDRGNEAPPRADGLMLEVASKSFGPETKAFTLNFRGKKSNPQSSVSPQHPDDINEAASAFSTEYVSELFVEGFKIQYLSFGCGSGCNNEINVKHYSRSCGVCSYKTHAEKKLTPGQSWESCNDARRTKVEITGGYDIVWYNWSFTFWNCA